MDDVIYRQDAIDAMTTECSWTIYDEHGQLTPNGEEIIGTLKKIPSARKKGHWTNIKISHTRSSADCSECGVTVNDRFCTAVHFCPNCGADMRGEADGENS